MSARQWLTVSRDKLANLGVPWRRLLPGKSTPCPQNEFDCVPQRALGRYHSQAVLTGIVRADDLPACLGEVLTTGIVHHSEVAVMAGSFAGSKSLGERRRRRLAADVDPIEANLAAVEFEADQDFLDDATPDEPATPRFPLQKLISSQPWKHWAIGLIASLVGVALLWLTHTVSVAAGQGNPGSVRLFDPAAGSMLPFFNSVLLFVSGQLALLVFWARSQSQRDFQGRYEIWAWMAGACFLFAGGLATDAHTAWSETVGWLWKLQFWKKDVLCWLAPTIVVALAISKPLRVDFRSCRTTSILLHLTAACWAMATTLTFQPALLADATLATVVSASLLVAGNVLLLTGMLHHARYVIYVNAEPSPLRPSWLTVIVRKMFAVMTRRKTHSVAPETAESVETRDDPKLESVTAAQSVVETEQEPVNDKPLETGIPAETAAEEWQTEAEEEAEAEDSRAKAQQSIQRRVDPSIDPDELKGLSKKERRRLRKQRRDAQRTTYDDE
jgi:hypothetical protein